MKHSGEHYTDGEIELIYRCAQSQGNNEALGKILGRTPSAIDWVHRHLDDREGIGERSSFYLTSQAKLVRLRVGEDARGQIAELGLALAVAE